MRHAEATGNIDRTFQGMIDTDISDGGKEQLKRLRARFCKIPLDKIYTSPLKRAVCTAEAVRAGRDIPVVEDEGLCEIMCGVWEGKSWESLERDYPKEYSDWKNNPESFCAPEGESMEHVYNRIISAIKNIAQKNCGKTIAVVSHGCALRNFMCSVRFGDISHLKNTDWLEHTGISCIEYDKDEIRIVFDNDFSHLDESMSTLKKQGWISGSVKKSE